MKNIYVIRNNIACENVSDIFTVSTHAQACQGFVHFLKSVEEKSGEKDTHFDLYFLATVNIDNLVEGQDEPVLIARGRAQAEACIASIEDSIANMHNPLNHEVEEY